MGQNISHDLQREESRTSGAAEQIFHVEIPYVKNFFEDEHTHYFHYFIKNQDGTELGEGLYTMEYPEAEAVEQKVIHRPNGAFIALDTENLLENMKKDALTYLNEHVEELLSKPYLEEVSPMLQDIVRDSIESDHGMVFIDVEEDMDREYYSDERLAALQEEVSRLDIHSYVEAWDSVDDLEEGDNLITAYMGVGTLFNLAEMPLEKKLEKICEGKVFDERQEEEILWGLQDGLTMEEVRSYANPAFSWERMRREKDRMMDAKKGTSLDNRIEAAKQQKQEVPEKGTMKEKEFAL